MEEFGSKRDQTLADEKFKRIVTNALKYVKSKLIEIGWITNNPPSMIAAGSIAMGEAITIAVIEIIENDYLVEDNLHINGEYNEIVLCEQVCLSVIILTLSVLIISTNLYSQSM